MTDDTQPGQVCHDEVDESLFPDDLPPEEELERRFADEFRRRRNEDVMKIWPVGAAIIAYAGVSLALYVETGDAGVPMSWPVGVAIAVLLYSMYIERRYARD